jgi:RNase adaptor protein for sRNA GlmZ degradation
MEAPNVIVYWDRSIITDKTTDFNRPDTVLIDIQNKTTLVIDTAVPSNHNLPKTVKEEITKNENLALEIRKFWRLNNHSI